MNKNIIFTSDIKIIKKHRGEFTPIHKECIEEHGFVIIDTNENKWCSGNVVDCVNNIVYESCYPQCSKAYKNYLREKRINKLKKIINE